MSDFELAPGANVEGGSVPRKGEAPVVEIDAQRRDLIRRMLLGAPVIMAMSARSAFAGGGHDDKDDEDWKSCYTPGPGSWQKQKKYNWKKKKWEWDWVWVR